LDARDSSPLFNAVNVIVVVAALTAGSAFLMWVGEQINDKGVGNGISMVLLINILSRIPQDMVTLPHTKGKDTPGPPPCHYNNHINCVKSGEESLA